LAAITARQYYYLILIPAAPMANLGNVRPRVLFYVFIHRMFIKTWRFTMFHCESTLRAYSNTKTSPIAQLFIFHFGFSVFYSDSTLNARAHTKAATVTFFFVDTDNLSDSHY